MTLSDALDPAPGPDLDDDARAARVRRARLPAPGRGPVPEAWSSRSHGASRRSRARARGHGGGRHRRPRGAAQHDRRRALAALDDAAGRRADPVEFELGTDLDVAAQDVRDKVARCAASCRPSSSRRSSTSLDFDDQPILWIPFTRDAAGRRGQRVRAPPREAGARDDPGRRAASRCSAAATAPSASGSTATALRARGLSASDVLRALQPRARRGAGRHRRGRAQVEYARQDRRRVPHARGARAAGGRARGRRAGASCATSRASRTAPRTCAPSHRYNGEPTVGHRHPQAVGRQHRRDRRRGVPAARRDPRDAARRASRSTRRRRLHRLLARDPRGGGGDAVRAGVRRAAGGADGVRVPAPHAPDADRRRGDPDLADRHLRRWSGSPATRSTP